MRGWWTRELRNIWVFVWNCERPSVKTSRESRLMEKIYDEMVKRSFFCWLFMVFNDLCWVFGFICVLTGLWLVIDWFLTGFELCSLWFNCLTSLTESFFLFLSQASLSVSYVILPEIQTISSHNARCFLIYYIFDLNEGWWSLLKYKFSNFST